MSMPNDFDTDDLISTFDDEDLGIPVTVAQCTCGRTWKVKISNLWLYDEESWLDATAFHFSKEHDQRLREEANYGRHHRNSA